ncbi:hypothetical protein OPT61_g8614 [Boeremia exigua]|uniref:Uncharacterized protein n=1 Tax=Boeremia exigua TaxID=749465 RepID=A0ACC2HXK2_9PLEO|nr:hypothetical protein OPT61_g8614 [Boeremia exigua]
MAAPPKAPETEHSIAFDADEKAEITHSPNDKAFKGDDSDGAIDWTPRTITAAIVLACLYTGSQIILYFVGGALGYIQEDLNATTNGSWLPVSNTLAITAIAPFVGYLQDLLGRREITLFGSVCIMVGIALVGTAHGFAQAVAGMTVAGVGAGICELTALAGISDIVPVKRRGVSLALVTCSVVPFTPYVIYSQLLATKSSWRWSMWICLIYNGVVFIGLAATYFPKSHPRMEGFTKSMILKQIDYVGAVLSIVGITLFLVALQAGGYTHPWTGAYVLSQLVIGLCCIIAWIVWEGWFAKNPMVPREIYTGQNIVGLSFFIAFVAGVNFYSLLNFFPLSFSAVYNPDPIQIGLKGLGYGISVTCGAVFFNSLLSIPSIPAKYILFTGTVLMTAFGGAIAVATPETPKLAVALGTIAGFGIGGVIVPSATVALICVPDAYLATTAALSLSIRTLGGSIGYTIYYNIFVGKLKKDLPEFVAKYALGAGLPATDATEFITTFLTAPAKIASAPGFTPAIAMAATTGSRWAYAESLNSEPDQQRFIE